MKLTPKQHISDVTSFFQQGLDLPHTHLALDELAKLHAASHAYIMSRAKDSSLEDVLKVFLQKLC